MDRLWAIMLKYIVVNQIQISNDFWAKILQVFGKYTIYKIIKLFLKYSLYHYDNKYL